MTEPTLVGYSPPTMCSVTEADTDVNQPLRAAARDAVGVRRAAGQALGQLAGFVGGGGTAQSGSGGPDHRLDGPLGEPVDRFVREVSEVLIGLASTVVGSVATKPNQLERDVAVEALNIVCAVIDADGRHGDDELWALAGAFAPRLGTQLGLAAPVDIRVAGVLTGKRAWVDHPSTLFAILVDHDRRDGTKTAWRYYELAMRIAHMVASLDSVPSPSELALIDTLRSTLTTAMAASEGPAPRRATGPGGPTSAASEGVKEVQSSPPQAQPLPPARPLPELLAELDALVGLEPVKAEVRLVADLLTVAKLRSARGLPVSPTSRHLVFTGNPGTGKTTVARLVAEIYRSLGVVEKGQLIETDRSGMVAGFVGQTATKVRAVAEQAFGGLLLIDEAYALARGGENDFGREAIDTLVKVMEDHREDLVVIAAGYPDEMADFIGANPGLSSRFPKTIHFPDYTSDELIGIFDGFCAKGRYTLADDARAAARTAIERSPRGKGFGNGRMVRNLFEASLVRQAGRIVDVGEAAPGATLSDEQLCALTPADILGEHPAEA